MWSWVCTCASVCTPHAGTDVTVALLQHKRVAVAVVGLGFGGSSVTCAATDADTARRPTKTGKAIPRSLLKGRCACVVCWKGEDTEGQGSSRDRTRI